LLSLRAFSCDPQWAILRIGWERLVAVQGGESGDKRQRHPHGWTENRIRELAPHHDRQTEEEQAAEIEAALSTKDQAVMVGATDLVPKLIALIARKHGA
jgi:hypothetical protein